MHRHARGEVRRLFEQRVVKHSHAQRRRRRLAFFVGDNKGQVDFIARPIYRGRLCGADRQSSGHLPIDQPLGQRTGRAAAVIIDDQTNHAAHLFVQRDDDRL